MANFSAETIDVSDQDVEMGEKMSTLPPQACPVCPICPICSSAALCASTTTASTTSSPDVPYTTVPMGQLR